MRLEVVFCLDRDQDVCLRNQRSAASPAFLSVSGILKDFQLSFPKQSSRSVCSPFNSTPHHTHSPHSPFRNFFFFYQGLDAPTDPTMAPVGGAPSHLTSAFTSASLLSDTSAEWQASSGSWRDAGLNLEPWIQTPPSHTHTQTLKLSISNAIFALFQLY